MHVLAIKSRLARFLLLIRFDLHLELTFYIYFAKHKERNILVVDIFIAVCREQRWMEILSWDIAANMAHATQRR